MFEEYCDNYERVKPLLETPLAKSNSSKRYNADKLPTPKEIAYHICTGDFFAAYWAEHHAEEPLKLEVLRILQKGTLVKAVKEHNRRANEELHQISKRFQVELETLSPQQWLYQEGSPELDELREKIKELERREEAEFLSHRTAPFDLESVVVG